MPPIARSTSSAALPSTPRSKPEAQDEASAPPESRYRAPALDKGLDILELLATQPEGLTRAEIVKEMDRSASEIYRMLERLVARQYVMRSTSGDRYALSLKLFALAHIHPPMSRLINQALPAMDDFARKAEQSCHMGVYDRGNVLISAQIDSPRGWSFSVQRGARVGLLDTASGHLLLAYADAGSYQRMLAEHTALDGEVPITEAKLRATLTVFWCGGYFFSHTRPRQHRPGHADLPLHSPHRPPRRPRYGRGARVPARDSQSAFIGLGLRA
jgi:DNA-binding IclR family transcriptional regulator